ncbi:hypothetical protein ACWCPS_00365 [Streptomyces mauvecolor]
MNEVFASTCAVTIPLLALAGVVEMRSAREQYEKRRTDGALTGNAARVMMCTTLIWAVLLLFSGVAEVFSLTYLADTESERARADDVSTYVLYALIAQMAFLVIVPAARAAFGITNLLDDFSIREDPENEDA